MASQMMMLNASPTEAERYSCPSCSKSFVRKAHMLRHQQQHASSKPFLCSFCSKSFKRSDVLRAHQFRCKERGGQPVPEGQSKGRKRSSCASCVKLRTRCDQETPCSRCQELGKECIRVPPTSNPESSPRQTDTSKPRSRDVISIAHLLNSPADNFGARFPIRDTPMTGADEDVDPSTVDSEDASEASHWSGDVESYDPYVGAPDNTFDNFFDGLETLTFNQHVLRGDSQPAAAAPVNYGPMAEILEPRAQEVREVLQVTAGNFGTTLPEASHMLELGPAIDALTGAEVEHLVHLYFQNYHRHCPILHRPSFQPSLCPLPLLLAVMAVGGMYAPDQQTVQRMRSLLDVIEAYIYGLPGIRDEYNNSFNLTVAPDEDTLHSQFEMLQGAYLIIVAQYFSGSLSAKRRARRQRFTRVLDISRSFKLPTAQHDVFLAIPDQAAFRSWIRTECKIRHFNIVMALDAAMSIFNNVPPRVSFGELDLALPCDPIYFDLSSYQEMVATGNFPKPKMKIIDAFQKLFTPCFELNTTIEKDKLNCWDMMLLSHCLYTHVWRQTWANPLLRSSSTTLDASPVVLEPLKTALRNWKIIWDDIRSSLTREQMRNMGFETSADSYWTLTKLIVHRFDPKTSTSYTSGDHQYLHDGSTSAQEMDAIANQFMKDDTVGTGVNTNTSPSDPPSATATEFSSVPSSTANGIGSGHKFDAIDFMPIEVDSDIQGLHLRKILRRTR